MLTLECDECGRKHDYSAGDLCNDSPLCSWNMAVRVLASRAHMDAYRSKYHGDYQHLCPGCKQRVLRAEKRAAAAVEKSERHAYLAAMSKSVA